MTLSDQPLFTVIVPNYNMEKFVKMSLQSVLDQTFTDFELLVIDNRSTDGSIKEITSLVDPRIRLFEEVCNIGMYTNLNVAVMLAKGKYIKVLCSDDIMHPQCLEVLAKTLEKEPIRELPLYIGYEMLVGKRGEEPPDSWREKDLTVDINPTKSDIRTGIATGLPNFCVDADAFRKFGGFGLSDAKKDFSRDMLQMGLFSEKCSCIMLDLDLSFERAHPGQNRYSMNKRWQLNEMYFLAEQTGTLNTPEGKVAIKTLAGHHLASSLKYLASGQGFGFLTHTLFFSMRKKLLGSTYFNSFINRAFGLKQKKSRRELAATA
jgi:glycosyltransferase involved in cell wall biosynthesis